MKVNKLLFTGEACKTELLVVLLEKHGIAAFEEHVSEDLREYEDEFNRETRVFVPDGDYAKAKELFFEDSGGEI